MTENMQKTIMECGFLPPSSNFVKQDPRGPEYGYFQVVIAVALTPDPSIRVLKRNPLRMLEWACTFDDQISFANWAKDNT